MRILHTMDTGGLYGKERMLLALIKKQVAEGHTVNVAGFGTNDFYEEAAKLCYSFHVEKVRHLWDVFNTHYDVIHTHDYKTGIITSAWHLLNRDRIVIRTLHGYTSHGKPWYAKIRLYEALDKFMTRFNSQTIAVSDELGKEFNVPVVFNGVEVFDPLDLYYVKRRDEIYEFCKTGIDMYERGFVFCCMARLSPEKNLKMLIEAIYQTDKAKLLLFGDGPMREELESMAKWKPEKFFFAGFDQNAPLYLQFVDAYIQPSLTEGMPISVLEAMSQGVPLLLTKVGGMQGLLSAGVASECYKGSAGLLASSLFNFMNKAGERQWHAERGQKLFMNRFTTDVMYSEYQKHYLAKRLSMEAKQCVE